MHAQGGNLCHERSKSTKDQDNFLQKEPHRTVVGYSDNPNRKLEGVILCGRGLGDTADTSVVTGAAGGRCYGGNKGERRVWVGERIKPALMRVNEIGTNTYEPDSEPSRGGWVAAYRIIG